MGIGVSIFLIAVGAILTFAIHVTNTPGFNINTIGVILMIVGGLGFLGALVFLGAGDWGGFAGRGGVSRSRRTTTYVDGGPAAPVPPAPGQRQVVQHDSWGN